MWQPSSSSSTNHSGPPERPPYEARLKAAQAVDVACRPFAQQEVDDARAGRIPVLDFHSSILPDAPLQLYAHGLAVRSGYGPDGFAIALALVGRFAVVAHRGLTPLTMHRLFAVCMHVGMKACGDRCLSNTDFASVAGFGCGELNDLEVRLLRALEFRALPYTPDVTTLPVDLAELLDRFCAGTLSTTVLPIVSDDSGDEADQEEDEEILAPSTASARAFYNAVGTLLSRHFNRSGGGGGAPRSGPSLLPRSAGSPDSAHGVGNDGDDCRESDNSSSPAQST